MTEQKAKQILIDWCNAQVGTREGVNNWRCKYEYSRQSNAD